MERFALKRCITCNLPETYPGIRYDNKGICNFCKQEKYVENSYLGIEALKSHIKSVLKKNDSKDRLYDAAVAFSGGRDSTYLLYYIKKVLNLSVIAVTMTHDFMAAQTLKNIELVTKKLEVDLHVIHNEHLNECSRKSVKAWAHFPNVGMLLCFCTGCRYGIKKLIPDFCRKQNIPLLFVGDTRLENMNYRQDLLSITPNNPTVTGKLAGYATQIFHNPSNMLSPHCMGIQGYEFFSPYINKLKKQTFPFEVAPFRDYLPYSQDSLIDILEKLGWEYDKDFRSAWRSDCYINMLRQYYYKRMLGFCDLDVYYARLIRQKKIRVEDAKHILSIECNYSTQFISHILQHFYDLDFCDIENRIRKDDELRLEHLR